MKLRIVVIIDYDQAHEQEEQNQTSTPLAVKRASQYLLVALSAVGKDLQPERLEQSHADYVLAFVADCDVVEEDPFEFETKPAIEIDVAHVDVTRVDVNLVQVPDHEGIVKKAECCLLSDSFAL